MAKGKGQRKGQGRGIVTAIEGAIARSKARTPGRGNAGATQEADEYEQNTIAAINHVADARADADVHALLNRDPTEAEAMEFAKLLRAGVPQSDALCYVLGAVEPAVIALALPRWMRSRLVVDALATLNGGRWPALEADARLDIALDKHYAEMAHYLYTHDFETAEGQTARKLDTARDALERLRTGRLEQNSPFMKFLQTLLKPSASVPALPDVRVLGTGERPVSFGLAEVEPAVEGEVTETEE